MEKIKDCSKAISGDFILYKGFLYTLNQIEIIDEVFRLTLDKDKVIDIVSDSKFTIYRIQ
ncbi:hypothetical protein WG906_04290 [Pedobacter sp. P351]|uniref:hypothetical protein n=1 Tax=Pedobacter superstes TaxID=3133441 RepID=UPI0030A5C035